MSRCFYKSTLSDITVLCLLLWVSFLVIMGRVPCELLGVFRWCLRFVSKSCLEVRFSPKRLAGTPNYLLTSTMCSLARINSIVSNLTCPLSYRIIFWLGSSFLTGLFDIRAAFAAYSKVIWFSSKKWLLGCKHAIITVWLFPPRLCLNKHVNLLSLYGIYLAAKLGFLYAVNAVITFLKVNKLLLISIDSFIILPSTAVRDCLSEPAKSTI